MNARNNSVVIYKTPQRLTSDESKQVVKVKVNPNPPIKSTVIHNETAIDENYEEEVFENDDI